MPVIKSAIKRVRQNEKRRGHNLVFKNELKAAVKAVTDAASANDKKDLDKKFKQAQSLLDKAVKKNIYHRNKVARKKSQLSQLVAEVGTKSAPAKKSSKSAKSSAAKKSPSAKKSPTPKQKSASKKSSTKK